MARHWKIAIAVLCVLFVLALITFPSLFRSVLRLRRASVTDEQARRAITQVPISTPSDAPQKAQLFWISASSPTSLEPTEVELPLSADPTERSKQIITALIIQAPTPAQRTLPADAQLLQFYLLPDDGSAVADFSEALGTETPSGILSEQMVVDSLVRTLAANVPAVHRLKILIHGQEAETLAGHVDLTDFFPVAPAEPAAAPPPATQSAAPPASAPSPLSHGASAVVQPPPLH